MSTVVYNCPRCSAQHSTFDVLGQQYRSELHGWSRIFELFCVCRNCQKSIVLVARMTEYNAKDMLYKTNMSIVEFGGSLNKYFSISGYINLKDMGAIEPPDYLPLEIENSFREGAACFAIGAPNASATMFRLCIDLATRPLLPAEGSDERPNTKVCRDLGLRLPWLFENGKLPDALHDLAQAVRDDGNDGAHSGTLTIEDAADLLDFTEALLERLYSKPERLKLAARRREDRRKPSS